MNTMTITKYVGAFCGSLLVFLLLSTMAGAIFDRTSEDVVAFSIENPEGDAAAAEAPAEEQVDVAALVAAADAAAGEGQFRKCAACHKLDGSNGVGPHLDGVFGRPIASVEGFSYSEALAGLDANWDPDHLYAFLQNPKGYAPGTAMAFAGLPKSEDRANLIAYLQTQAP